MQDPWIEREWNDLCGRLQRCAEYYGAQAPRRREMFRQQAQEFQRQPLPKWYPAFLERVRAAARLAKTWDLESTLQATEGDLVDEALWESFPASDPPSWTAAAI